MSKKRTIDSKIRTSQTFAGLTYRQRDLWQGLIEVADDQGRLPGIPTYIRSAIWPFDDINLSEVSRDLQALVDAGNIIFYNADGGTYIQLINWWKYQQSQWAAPSDYPAPPLWIDRCRYHGKGNHIVISNWDQVGGFPNGKLSSPLHSALDSTLSCRDVNDEVKGSGEDEGEDSDLPNFAAPSAAKESFLLFPRENVTRIVANATGMMAIPPKEQDRVEQIHALVDTFGEEKVTDAMKSAYQKWRSTRRKDGSGNYRGTNFGWVDWAQDSLASGPSPGREVTEEERRSWTTTEWRNYLQQMARQQEAST